MKFSAKLLALVLALAMLAGMTAFASEDEDPILFTFNGQEYPASYVEKLLYGYESNGYITSSYAYDEAIDYLIVNKLAPLAKANELGLDQFTDEELEKFNTLAEDYFYQHLDAYVEYYTDSIETDKEALREEILSYWEDIGTTVDVAKETHLFNQIKARLMETIDVEVTEEEITEVFNEQIEKDRELFENNIPAYEYYTYYLDYSVWFRPEGYRSIQQIMLMVDEDLVEDYKEQLTEGDEKKIAKAEQAMLDSRKDTIDAIYARLDAGNDFIAVRDEFTEDPALDEWVQENGYYVHPENTIWPDNFAAASFSEDLKEIGDYASQPVVSKNGIHIVMYAGDIPGGSPELTDDIREGIVEHITNEKRADVVESWAAEYEVVYNQEAIDEKIAERKAAYEAYEASLAG